MERELNIRTVYYRGRDVVKKIASGHPINAVKNCVGYMRTNKYEATHAEVYNEINATLYAVIKNDVRGNTQILYEHKAGSKAENKAFAGVAVKA